MRFNRLILLPCILGAIFFFGCRKDITLPDTESEKIFGTWKLIETLDGFSGQLMSHNGSTTNEYKQNGVLCIRHAGKKKHKYTFRVHVETPNEMYSIQYFDTGITRDKEDINFFMYFQGSDTLVLDNTSSQSIYARK